MHYLGDRFKVFLEWNPKNLSDKDHFYLI